MSERIVLHDESIMQFGVHRGRRLGDIPDDYWLWFLKQTWCKEYPDLVAYAKIVEKDNE